MTAEVFGSSEQTGIDPSSIRRLLLIKLSSFGDIVHLTGVLDSIRNHFRDAEITLAVGAPYKALVENEPCIDRIAVQDPATKSLDIDEARDFDLAVDLQGSVRSARVMAAVPARIRAGRGIGGPPWAGTIRPDLSRHAVLVCADVARSVGVEAIVASPRLRTSPAAEAEAERILEQAGLPASGFVVVNPFTRHRSKTWPLGNYRDLAEALVNQFSLPVAVTGTTGEADEAGGLDGLAAAGAISLAGALSLAQALCIYRRARFMISGDTGPLHAAAALGTSCLAFYGPTFPERTGPWGEEHIVLQRLFPLDHRPYRLDANQRFMLAIDTATAYRAMAAMIDRTGPQ